MNERIRIGHVAQRERENGWLSFYLTDRPEYDEDRVNLIQLIPVKQRAL